jgi:3'-phosphoadenosine 5'-phosphosulfate sulfotransferase (PAPS reductase)/FAD synthetase
MSGGKDSTATALLALARHGREACRFVFADTGNEHEETVAYLDYLRLALDIRIDVVRADFSQEIAAKRMFIARDKRNRRTYSKVEKTDAAGVPVWVKGKDGKPLLIPVYAKDAEGENTEEVLRWDPVRASGWDGGKKIRWSNRRKREALAILQPTGNPFLDLCLWKGRFPSRKAQFCTQHLKTIPLVEYQMALVDQGFEVWSWQGVRRDESQNRRNVADFEYQGGGISVNRPIAAWTAQETVDYVRSRGILLNPLYSQGMGRVGCMPCINANKGELREIGRRFPEHVARIAQWERLVGEASKRRAATFIPAPGITPAQAKDHGIYSVIEWAKTGRGGRQFDLIAATEELPACSSAYGLCE